MCGRGHINDFPWVKWTHAKNRGGPKQVCANPQLTFTTSPVSSEGLDGLSLKCTACNASATLKDAFNDGEFERLDEKTENKYDSHVKEDIHGKIRKMPAMLPEGAAEGKFFRVFPGNCKFSCHSAVFRHYQ